MLYAVDGQLVHGSRMGQSYTLSCDWQRAYARRSLQAIGGGVAGKGGPMGQGRRRSRLGLAATALLGSGRRSVAPSECSLGLGIRGHAFAGI